MVVRTFDIDNFGSRGKGAMTRSLRRESCFSDFHTWLLLELTRETSDRGESFLPGLHVLVSISLQGRDMDMHDEWGDAWSGNPHNWFVPQLDVTVTTASLSVSQIVEQMYAVNILEELNTVVEVWCHFYVPSLNRAFPVLLEPFDSIHSNPSERYPASYRYYAQFGNSCQFRRIGHWPAEEDISEDISEEDCMKQHDEEALYEDCIVRSDVEDWMIHEDFIERYGPGSWYALPLAAVVAMCKEQLTSAVREKLSAALLGRRNANYREYRRNRELRNWIANYEIGGGFPLGFDIVLRVHDPVGRVTPVGTPRGDGQAPRGDGQEVLTPEKTDRADLHWSESESSD